MVEQPHPHSQGRYEVRLEWGSRGAESILPGAGALVLVDVLSFTTMVEIALTQGLEVLPFDADGDPAEFARSAGAVLAHGRRESGLSLSPSSITADAVAAAGPARRLLVRSLNGSRLSAALGRSGVPVLAAGLRNRTAVAKAVLRMREQRGERLTVAVVAAGEARRDGTTRFALEDFLGAGAVVDALAEVGIDYCSPEAAAAAAAFTGLQKAIAHLLTASASGQELIESGFRPDVELAAELDVSSTVPVLRDGVFRRLE